MHFPTVHNMCGASIQNLSRTVYIIGIKGSGQFFFVFLAKPLYEVCLIRIKKQVAEKRSTVCTHRYADCLLKNTSTKENKYVVNQQLEHVDDISFRELFGRIRVIFSQNKICPFLAQEICIYNGHYFFMLDQLP